MAVTRRSAKPAGGANAGKLKAVGAFIFAGGFTLGVRQHFDVLAHLEDGDFGADTARKNFPGMLVEDNHSKWPVLALVKEGVDFVYCNPPCAPWSAAGSSRNAKGGWRTDVRASCVAKSFELLRQLEPKVWCFESVRNVYSRGRDMIDDMEVEALKLGYSVTHLFTEARNHGVPQPRRRYFMVCHKVRMDWKPPHSPPGVTAATIGEAMSHVKDPMGAGCANLGNLMTKLYKHTLVGERPQKAFDRLNAGRASIPRNAHGKVIGRPGFLYRKVSMDEEAPTLTGSATLLHPKQERFLSVNEYKALCSYPQDFEFVGSVSSAYAQLTKAVMPNVGEYVASVAARSIRNGSALAHPRVLGEVWVHPDKVDVRDKRSVSQVAADDEITADE